MAFVRRRAQLAHCEVSSPLPAEVLHTYSQETVPESERVAKRRRIEAHAQDYLRGRDIFISTASLKGPFDRGWVNPWSTNAQARQAEGNLSQVSLRVADERGRGFENLQYQGHQEAGTSRPKVDSRYCHDWVLGQDGQDYSNHGRFEGQVCERDLGSPIGRRQGRRQRLQRNDNQRVKALSNENFESSHQLDSSSDIVIPTDSMHVEIPTTVCAAKGTIRQGRFYPPSSPRDHIHDDGDLTRISAITDDEQMLKVIAEKDMIDSKPSLANTDKQDTTPGFQFRRVPGGNKPTRTLFDAKVGMNDATTEPSAASETFQSVLDELEETGAVLVSQNDRGRWFCPMESCSRAAKTFGLRSGLSNHLKNFHNVHKTRTGSRQRATERDTASVKSAGDMGTAIDANDDEDDTSGRANREATGDANITSAPVTEVVLVMDAQGQWPCPIDDCPIKPYKFRGHLTKHLKTKHPHALPKATISTDSRTYVSDAFMISEDASGRWPCPFQACKKPKLPYMTRPRLENHLEARHRIQKSRILCSDEPNLDTTCLEMRFQISGGLSVVLNKDGDGNWPCPIQDCPRHEDPYPYRTSAVKHIKIVHGLSKINTGADKGRAIEVYEDSEGKWPCPVESCEAQLGRWPSRHGLQYHLKKYHDIHRTTDISSRLKREQRRQSSDIAKGVSFHTDEVILSPCQGKFRCPCSDCPAQTQLFGYSAIQTHLRRVHNIFKTTLNRQWNKGPATAYIQPHADGTFSCPLIEGCLVTTPFTKNGVASHLERWHEVEHVHMRSTTANGDIITDQSVILENSPDPSRSTPTSASSRLIDCSEHGTLPEQSTDHISSPDSPIKSKNSAVDEPKSTNSATQKSKHMELIQEQDKPVDTPSKLDRPDLEGSLSEQAYDGMTDVQGEVNAETDAAEQGAGEPTKEDTGSTLPDRQPDSRAYSNFTVNPEISTQMALDQAHEAFGGSPMSEKSPPTTYDLQAGDSREDHAQPLQTHNQDTNTPFKVPIHRRPQSKARISDFRATPANTQDLLDAAADLSFSTVKKLKPTALLQPSSKDTSVSDQAQIDPPTKGVEWSPTTSTPSLEHAFKTGKSNPQPSKTPQTPVPAVRAQKPARVVESEATQSPIEELPAISPFEKVSLALLAAKALTPTARYSQQFRASQTPSGPSEMPVPSYQPAQRFSSQDVEDTLDEAMSFLGTWDIDRGSPKSHRRKGVTSSFAA